MPTARRTDASSARCASWSTTSLRTARSRDLATLPLIAHQSPDAVVAYRAGSPVLAARFLSDVHHLARSFPPCTHVLNTCVDRYHFTVGFAAALISGRVSLLPSSQAPEMLRQLRVFAPDVVCLSDEAEASNGMPCMTYPRDERLAAAHSAASVALCPVPDVDAAQRVAYVFTSGSTGTPLPHPKTFGRLIACIREQARRLELHTARWALLATVPPQHMYGFEASVLLPLATGHALCAERPFYPADIAAALERLPRPRALLTTPVHLRALLGSGIALPPADLVLSSTAALSQQLAAATERRFDSRLLEIYGSTETGQIAIRRPTSTAEWRLWPGVSLEAESDGTWARGGHIERPTRLPDLVELTGVDRFLLHGRVADLVNIAGKRSSLAYLNHQLNSIQGVEDGAFFHVEEPADSHTGVARVAACVVAPSLGAERLLAALRERIDAVFLPRPLVFVAELPRNGTGKLPLSRLRSLAAQAKSAPTG